MSYGNKKQSKVYYFTIAGLKKEEEKVYFKIKEASSGDESTADYVGGVLTKIKFATETYESKSFKVFTLYIRDGEELYLLKTRFNSISRTILNCLINMSKFDNIQLSLGKNKKGYKSVWCESSGQNYGFALSIDEMKELTFPIKDSDGVIKEWDRKQLDKKLTELVEEKVLPLLKEYVRKTVMNKEETTDYPEFQTYRPESQNKSIDEQIISTEEEINDDLPF